MPLQQSDQFVQQVDEIRAILNDESIYVGHGQQNRGDQRGKARRVYFVCLGGGADEPAEIRGSVEITDTVDEQAVNGRYAKPRAIVPTLVHAFITAESFATTRILLSNVREASRQALGPNSLPGRWEVLTQKTPRDAGKLLQGAELIRQAFTWRLHTFKGLVALPPCNEEPRQIIPMGDLGLTTDYTHTVEREPDPETEE